MTAGRPPDDGTRPAGAGALISGRGSPTEVVRLLRECHDALGPDSPEWWGPNLLERIEAARSGQFLGVLWVGPKDEAVGVADWTDPGGAGRIASLYLTPGYRNPGALASFVRALDVAEPLRGITGPILGMPEPVSDLALAGLGFESVHRIDMVYPLDRPLPELREAAPGVPAGRSLVAADEDSIAALMARAYDDNRIDRRMFQTQRDPVDDARVATGHLIHGELGTWIPRASFGVEFEGRLVAATMVNEFHGPLISEVMTDPSARRVGHASRLIVRSLGAARALGLPEPRLVVTLENERAHRLYRSLGFRERPETLGNLWLRLGD